METMLFVRFLYAVMAVVEKSDHHRNLDVLLRFDTRAQIY